MEVRRRSFSRICIPAVGEQYATNIQKQACNLRRLFHFLTAPNFSRRPLGRLNRSPG
jgi:hypothetical protein